MGMMIKWFLKLIGKGKIRPTTDVPFRMKNEKFVGFKITWPWWGEPKDKDKK